MLSLSKTTIYYIPAINLCLKMLSIKVGGNSTLLFNPDVKYLHEHVNKQMYVWKKGHLRILCIIWLPICILATLKLKVHTTRNHHCFFLPQMNEYILYYVLLSLPLSSSPLPLLEIWPWFCLITKFYQVKKCLFLQNTMRCLISYKEKMFSIPLL